jgi:hypothetical protein
MMANKTRAEGGETVAANFDASLARLQAANATHATGVTTRLVAALENLPTDYVVPNGKIPYRAMIPSIAHNLTRMARAHMKSPSPATLNCEIDRVISALRKLEILGGLVEEDALVDAAVKHEVPPKQRGVRWLPLTLALRLITLAGQARELAHDIDAARPAATMKPERGRKPATEATAIAAFLYQEFERITGHAAGRSVQEKRDNQKERESGKFVLLVREVFEILGVPGSPEQAARNAIEAAKSMGPNQD